MAVYNSYNDFLTAAGLAQKAGPVVESAFENEPVEYRTMHGNYNSPFQAASTFINDVKKPNQSSDTTFVTIGNSGYIYPMSLEQMNTWMRSQSLGKYYNNFIKRG